MNFFIRFTIEMFLPVSIGGLINLYSLKSKPNGEGLASFIAFLIVITFILTPLAFLLVLIRNKDFIEIQQQQYLDRYGTITYNLKTIRFSQYIYHTLTVQKWQVTAIMLVFLRDTPSLQTIVLLFQSVMMQIYLIRYKPFIEPRDNHLELINELLYCIYIYSYIMISDYFDLQQINTDSQIFCKQLGGWTLIGLIGASLLINIGFMIWNGVKEVKSRLPPRWRRAKLRISNFITKGRVTKYETPMQSQSLDNQVNLVTQELQIPGFYKIIEQEVDNAVPSLAPRASSIDTIGFMQSTLTPIIHQQFPNDAMQRRIPQLTIKGLGPCLDQQERPKLKMKNYNAQDNLVIKRRGRWMSENLD
ncbi:hypothetical protein FGO68_gene222 [Halteria grandinella]|uniref:Uncharacterized protein n=1 Tax=Halteria grandinella TaxID=5974 RepID=A0A8J8T8N5_HALGN|nr:hypothetical protein FGO68_gene222 [Halteria grandinella]